MVIGITHLMIADGIVRKIGIMAKIPENKTPCDRFVAISRTEYADFVEQTIRLLIQTFVEKSLV